MSLSRRRFIKTGALAALSAGFIFKGGEALVFGQKSRQVHTDIETVPYEAHKNPILYYKASAFETYVGCTFISRDAPRRSIQTEIVQCIPLESNANAKRTSWRTRETDY